MLDKHTPYLFIIYLPQSIMIIHLFIHVCPCCFISRMISPLILRVSERP